MGTDKDYYYDAEGDAVSTLILDPVNMEMSLQTYTCSLEIVGTDGDMLLTAAGFFVVQCKLESMNIKFAI